MSPSHSLSSWPVTELGWQGCVYARVSMPGPEGAPGRGLDKAPQQGFHTEVWTVCGTRAPHAEVPSAVSVGRPACRPWFRKALWNPTETLRREGVWCSRGSPLQLSLEGR